jgi:hypothetical protein
MQKNLPFKFKNHCIICYVRFYPSAGKNKRDADSGECFFLGQPGGMAAR